jgi:tetratricopeptide (TPR) repeat protein
MAQNWLRITHQDDKIQLSWQQGLFAPRSAPPVNFEHPFDEETLTDLRWYLEKFLPFPYGIFPDKAKKIEQKLQEWGQRLFELVFPRSTKAWDFFCEATREGLDKCEINISSDDPTVLNLPWELLHSSDYQFLAPSLAGMYRSLNGHAVRSPMGQLPQDKLNILLVIARPYGEKDVALKTIARPLLEALKPIQKYVNLKVLRPPSFEEFERELNANKGFYHIVHFDGHGNFDPDSTGFQYSFGSKGQGVLVFENIDGSPQIITATQIAQSLNDCRVPIFVLNACKSAQEGDGSFSSVATRLVSLGAKGVVAMAYNVQVEAAKHFIGRFYQQLVAGTDVSTAVAAARRQVLNQRLRPTNTTKGDLPLADWMVPVLYQQETYTPFVPTSNSTEDILNIDNFLEEPVSNLVGFPEQGRYGFIGRDYDILRLERSFRRNNIMLLQGMGGVGKTELTVGYARWLEETQGREKIFFTSFESGASLSRVVNEVGRAVWKDKFSQYTAEQQQRAVLKYLQSQPCLLIWDNFEPVMGFPEGNEPLLSEDERDHLKHFLKELHGGQTWVLITSRREETWLDCGYSLINLQGLSPVDAQEFAAKILRSLGVEIKNLPEEYLDLLKLLGGHPLSLRVVLPHLRYHRRWLPRASQTPTQVIEVLRQGLDSLEKKTEAGRDKSLIASLDYSFSKLSEKAKTHLPFLGLFCEKVYVYTLSNFSKEFSFENIIGFGKTYKSIFGTYFEIEDWLEILNEAVEAGILEDIGDGIFRLYPVLPWYLRQKLSHQYNTEKISNLQNKLLIFYVILAVAHDIQERGNAEQAITLLLLEEANLLQYFRLALNQKDWSTASGILKPLGQVYDILGFSVEYRSYRERALNKIGVNLVNVIKGQDKSAFEFWTYLKSADALEALRQGELEKARQIHQEILDFYQSLNDSSVIWEIAIAYANLGTIERENCNYNIAISYYHKAIKIYQDISDCYQETAVYYEIGVTARQQKDFETAIKYFQQCLKFYQDAEDYYRLIGIYQEMGIIARFQGNFNQAILMYEKALYLCDELGHDYFGAGVYHELGEIAKLQGNLFLAKQCYYKSLQVYEDKKDWYNASDEYQGLGEVAQVEEKFDEAITYFQKAL